MLNERGLRVSVRSDLVGRVEATADPEKLPDAQLVELINGALVREARRHGVVVPLQTALYRLVKAKEASYS